MSADLLRRAAAKTRSTAALASRELDGDPWDTTDPGEASDIENHIALWSPDVAELVAGVIDLHADVWEVNGGEMEKLNPIRKLAERILGEGA